MEVFESFWMVLLGFWKLLHVFEQQPEAGCKLPSFFLGVKIYQAPFSLFGNDCRGQSPSEHDLRPPAPAQPGQPAAPLQRVSLCGSQMVSDGLVELL